MASGDDGRKNGPRLRSPRVGGLEIDCDNIEALLKRITTLTQVTGCCMYSEEGKATFDADAEVAKFHDGLLKAHN